MNIGFHTTGICRLLGFGVLLATPVLGQGTGNEANKKLRSSIQRWVAVMKETQAEQGRWQRDQQILEDSRVALTREIDQLKSEIASAEERIAATDSESADKLARRRMYEKAREAFRSGLDRVEAEVSSVIPLLPRELSESPKLDLAVREHRKFAESDEKDSLSLNKRLNAMLTILAEAEKFNQSVQTFGGRSMAVDGEYLLLDVVYFGLALGYAANSDGSLAFLLKPTELGWMNRKIDDEREARAVRDLVDVAQRNGEVRLVKVPMTVDE